MFKAHEPLTRARLRAIPVPKRRPYKYAYTKGNRWTPLQHGDVADALMRAIRSRHDVRSETWVVARNDYALLGSVEVDGNSTRRYIIGVRHSNDGVWAPTLLVGARRMRDPSACVWTSEIGLGRRHTAALDLNVAVTDGLDQWDARCVDEYTQMENALDDPIDLAHAITELVSMATAGVFPKRYLEPAASALRVTHGQEPTRWAIYAAVWQANQPRSEIDQLETMARAREHLCAVTK